MLKRILSVFGANVFGQIITLLIQVLSVPLFLYYWGASLYGDWLVLTALPGYLSISGSGIGFVAGNTMQKHVASNENGQALGVFQSALVLLLVLSIFLFLLAVVVVFNFPISNWLNVNQISVSEVRLILVILALYVLFGLQTELLSSVYRANGDFARGILIMNILRLLEFAGLCVSLIFGGKAVLAALVYLGIRLFGILWMLIGIRRFSWPEVGFKHARGNLIRSELIPTFSFLGFPLGHAFMIQGMTTVVGVQLGSNAVVIFSTVRTLTGFIKQFSSSIYYSVWPEFSGTISTLQLKIAKELHRSAFQLTLLFSVASGIFLFFFGPFIFRMWTGGDLVLEKNLLFLMLLSTVPNTLWMMSSYVSISINKHTEVAFVYSILAVCASVIAYYLCPSLGVIAVPIATLICDLVILVFVLNRSFRIVQDNLREFALFMISSFPFRSLFVSDGRKTI